MFCIYPAQAVGKGAFSPHVRPPLGFLQDSINLMSECQLTQWGQWYCAAEVKTTEKKGLGGLVGLQPTATGREAIVGTTRKHISEPNVWRKTNAEPESNSGRNLFSHSTWARKLEGENNKAKLLYPEKIPFNFSSLNQGL